MTNEVEQPKKLPLVIKLRVERILLKGVEAVYETQQENVIKAVYPDGKVTYVDLAKRQEIKSTQLKIELEEWGKNDTETLLGKPVPEAVSPEATSREDVAALEEEEPPKKTVKKTAAKKKSK